MDYNWIDDRLAVGAIVSEMEELPFDAILSMATEAPASVGDLVQSGRIEYQWHSIVDGYCWEQHDEIVRRFDGAADQIHEWISSGKRVLVHCHAGVSRAATAAAWYLVRHEGLTWDEALERIQDARPIVNPNVRFEIPLRMATGEHLTSEWIDRRLAEYARRIEQEYDVEVDPQIIRQELEEQGTLPLVAT